MKFNLTLQLSSKKVFASVKQIKILIQVPATQLEVNFCDEVKECLGISPTGSVTKFLNERGEWVEITGGGAVDSVNGQTGDVVLDKSDVGLGNVDNTSDVDKPVSNAQAIADTAVLNASKAYADGLVTGLLDDRGNYNASSNLFPSTGGSGTAGAILKGDLWTVNVAGTLGGVAVTAGDVVRALVDTPGQTSSNWAIGENNIGYVAENQANKSSTMAGNEASTSIYLSAKGVFDWASSVFTTTSAVASQIAAALTGYATQAWVTSQGYITNVVTALGFTPENVANKQNSLAPDGTGAKYPTVDAVNALALNSSRIIASDFNNVVYTASATAETILMTVPIPANSFGVGIDPDFEALITKVGTTSFGTYRFRISTTLTPSPIGTVPSIGSFVSNANQVWLPFERVFPHIDSSTSTLVTGQTANTDSGAIQTAFVSLNIDWTVTQYLHLTVSFNTTSADVITAHKIIART